MDPTLLEFEPRFAEIKAFVLAKLERAEACDLRKRNVRSCHSIADFRDLYNRVSEGDVGFLCYAMQLKPLRDRIRKRYKVCLRENPDSIDAYISHNMYRADLNYRCVSASLAMNNILYYRRRKLASEATGTPRELDAKAARWIKEEFITFEEVVRAIVQSMEQERSRG